MITNIIFFIPPIVFAINFKIKGILIASIATWLLIICGTEAMWLLHHSYLAKVTTSIWLYLGLIITIGYSLVLYLLFSSTAQRSIWKKVLLQVTLVAQLLYLIFALMVIYAKQPKQTPAMVFHINNNESVLLSGSCTTPSFFEFYRPCKKVIHPEKTESRNDLYITIILNNRGNVTYKGVKVIIELLDNANNSTCYIFKKNTLSPGQLFFTNIPIDDKVIQDGLLKNQISIGKHYVTHD